MGALGINIFKKKLNAIDFKSARVINTINAHSYCISKKDKDFENALKFSDILLPDGVGIVWAERILNNNNIQKIAGFDIFRYTMLKLDSEKGSCFFLGSNDSTLKLIKDKVRIEYPNIVVNSFSPPYKSDFSDIDSKAMCDAVNKVQPDVLFVGMTAPKQEKWVHKFKDQLKVRNICSIGAVFDFYAGNMNRAPNFIIKIGLEWLHRSLTNRRLLVRNFISNPKFIFYILKIKFLIK